MREQWFASLRDVSNRRREPWVLEGLGYLHHPLRAEASKKYVQPSLDLLWEIQKTGDIFFPKRWLDATSAATRRERWRTRCAHFSRTCRRTIPSACETSRCNRPTSCIEPRK